MGLDDRLEALAGRAGREGAPGQRQDVDVDGALGAVRGMARRRQRRRRVALGSAAAAMALLVGGLVLAAVGTDEAQRVITEPDGPEQPGPPSVPDGEAGERGADAPPAVDRSEAHLWLSEEVLPPEGGDLAVVIVDPTATGDTWGVAGALEVWDGAAWSSVDFAQVCMDFWGCPGEVGGRREVALIGLAAQPVGPLTWLRTGPLEPGWYRLVQTSNEGTAAAGQFEVRIEAPSSPPSHRGGAHLEVEPAVLFADPALRADPASPLPPPQTSVPQVGEAPRGVRITGVSVGAEVPRAWQDGGRRFERWDGARWVAASIEVVGGISPGIEPSDPLLLELELPAPGAYRILSDTEEATIEGRFWVVGEP
jgi:hypothetical protein